MNSSKLLLVSVALSSLATEVSAQGTQQNGRPQQGYSNQGYASGSRTPVATQPSNNPFRNPIGQGVPPAASANSGLNSNRTFAPR